MWKSSHKEVGFAEVGCKFPQSHEIEGWRVCYHGVRPSILCLPTGGPPTEWTAMQSSQRGVTSGPIHTVRLFLQMQTIALLKAGD